MVTSIIRKLEVEMDDLLREISGIRGIDCEIER